MKINVVGGGLCAFEKKILSFSLSLACYSYSDYNLQGLVEEAAVHAHYKY